MYFKVFKKLKLFKIIIYIYFNFLIFESKC
jgi:hypothetical protein